jgi:hypothetical protein
LLQLFLRWVSLYVHAGLDCDLPIYASYIARLTGMCHHAQLFIGWNVVLWTFCQDWLPTVILSNFDSRIARITGLSHHACPPSPFCLFNFERVLYFCTSQSGLQSFPFASWITEMTRACLYAQLYWLRWSLANFLLGWSQTVIFLISTSSV